MRRSVCAGEDMIMNGRVTWKFESEGEHRVDLQISITTPKGLAYNAGGTLAASLAQRLSPDPWAACLLRWEHPKPSPP